MKRALLLALLPCAAFAWEKGVRRSQVPPAALETVQRVYPGAVELSYDQDPGQDCKMAYGIHIRYEGRLLEINVFPSGEIRDVELTLRKSEYPEAVLAAWHATKYGDYVLERLNRITIPERADKVVYELLVSRDNRSHTLELTFDGSGKLINEYQLNPHVKDDRCVS